MLESSMKYFTVGVTVHDTIYLNIKYNAVCSDDFLDFSLDSALIDHVTGLSFQIEITATEGLVLSNIVDTVKVGDTFSLPTANESGILRISFAQSDDSFSFLTKLVGTPQIAEETYYCNLSSTLTSADCYNIFDISFATDSVCRVDSFPTSISDPSEPPIEYMLKQNYPNPFNPSTNISYSIPTSSFVTLKIYDILGREVHILVNEFQQYGTYSIQFDVGNLASGVYFYKLQVGSNFNKTKKLLLMR